MKRVIRKFFFAAAIAIAALSNVEAQNSFAYQAVIRTAKGELVSNQEIAMQFSLIYDGKVVYSETQKPKTNQYGNVQVEVGKGQKVSGSFAEVPWSTMQVMMKIEADPNGGTNYIDLGTIQLQPAPYAMYAPAAGAVSAVQAGDPKSDSDALFEVKDKDGNVVFAVYPDGVRVFVNDTASKAVSTGFAVAGRRAAKEGEDANIFEVNAAGTQVFVNEEDTAGGKAMQTGFAVSGRKAAKDGSDLFTVGSTGTQVYIDEDATKAISTGFAVSGRRAAKGEEKYLEINVDGTRVYVDDADSDKPIQTGFAVSGRRAAKEDSNNKMLEINAEGTKIYVGSDGKVMPTGFAVSGRKAAKGKEIKLFEVNSFGTQIYIDAQNDKAMRTGFAVSGRKAAKDGSPDKYMVIDADGTVIYVDYEEAKAIRTGFAVSGRKAAKNGTPNTILKVDNVEGTRAYVEDIDGKAISTGFAVSGRRAAKDGEPDFFHITSDQATITATNITMQDKDTDKDMMSITSGNTSIYTDDFSLSNNDDTEMLTANNGGVEVSTELVIAGEVAQTVDVEENEDVDPLVLSAFGMIETVKIADSIPDLDAPKGYSLLKIYGNGKFAQTQNLDAEENTYMLFNAAGNLVANQSDAVAAVILTNASTPDAKLIIWPLKQVNNAPISLGLMAAGDTLNRYVPVNVYVNADGPVECLVDVKSADEELGKVRIEGPKVYGSKVEIHAEPIVEGYHFAGWSDERSANPRTVLILHDTAFADATFAINTYNIKTTAENGEIEISGQQNDDGTFNHGTEVGLNAFASEHYHFMSWTDGEAKAERNFKIVSDTAFEATFAIDSFLIKTIATEGGTVTKDTLCPYGAEIELVATPDEANGYHFVNWNDGNTDNPRKLIVENESTFSAYFDKNRYLLTYMVDDKEYKIDTIACDAQIVPIDAPDKVGYKFKWWENMQGVMPKNNLTVIAQYDKESYTITFNTGGGSEIASITDNYETEIAQPKDEPTKLGYKFMGWDTDFPLAMPVGGLTVNAIWEVKPYTIAFIENDGVWADNYNKPAEYNIESEKISLPNAENINKAGYTFKGWQLDGEIVTEIAKGSVGDKKLTAQWEPITYAIDYTLGEDAAWKDGFTPTSSYTIESETFTLPGAENIAKTGYTFKGWQLDGVLVTEIAKGSLGYKELTAQWEINTYTLTASANDGEMGEVTVSGTQAVDGNYAYNTEVTLTATAKPYYRFVKWNDKDESTESELKFNITENTTLTATFEPIPFTIKYNLNGTESAPVSNSNSETYTVKDLPLTIVAPERTGYTFGGWYTTSDFAGEPFTQITSVSSTSLEQNNHTLYAKWIQTSFYVKADGSDAVGRYGTIDDKFAKVQTAFDTILKYGQPNMAYKIVVDGILEGGQSIGDFFDDENGEEATTLEGTTITLIGEKNGDELAVLNAEYTGDEETDVALLVYTNIPVIIENLTITGGGSRDGGGILVNGAVEDGIMSHVTLSTGAIVTNNYVLEGGGGGVSVNGEGSTFKMLPGSKITNNIAGTEDDVTNGGSDGQGANGGGVYVGEGSVFVMAGGVISGNEAVSPESDYGHYYGRGGGVYNEGVMYMYGSAVIGDTTQKEPATASQHSNIAMNGGGIFNNCGQLWIGYKPAENEGGEPVADNDFAGGIAYNYASANGGGIGLGGYLAVESNHIYKGKIAYNAAAEEGGGIGRISDNSGYSALYIDNSTIVGNEAGINGGGLYLNNNYLEIDKMSVKNTTISNNTAGNDGGGLYFGGEKPIQLSNCIVTDNVTGSDGNGGGIYFDGNDSSFALDYCQVTGNSALKGAGVYLVGNGELHMNSGSITDNVLHEDPNEEDSYDDPHGKGVFINYSSEMYVSGAPIVDEVYGEYPTVVYIELEKIEVYDDYGYPYYEDGEPLLSSGARIKVTPSYYNGPSVYGDYVSYGTEIIGNCTADNYEYFTVTPNDEHDWVINEEGYLTYECTVEFTGDGTGRISNQTVMLGGKIDNPTDELQEQEGKCFAGWVDDKNQFFYPDHSVVTGNMTLTAQWVKPFTDIYVNAIAGYSANDSDKPQGDVDNQFTTIQDAVDLIASFNQSDLDYTIHVTGMDNNSVIIPEDRSYFVEYYDEEDEELKIDTVSFKIAKSILVKGETDESGINASQPVCVYTSAPVTFKNFNVTVGNNFTIVDDAMSLSVGERADVTLANGTDLNGGKNANDHRYAIVVRGKLTMDCANIHDYGDIGYYGYNTATNYLSGGIWVDGGELLMKGNSSIYGCFGDYGGAIHIERGTVTMEGDATIGGEGKGCKASSSGGAVYINEGSFKMDGSSSISYCTKGRNLSNDGSVSIYNGRFTMKGDSKIHHNAGSGVYVDASTNNNKYNTHGTFKMEGGSIKNNSEDGVYVNGSGNNEDSFGVFEMSGGTISDNIGHGVFVYVYSDNAGYAPHGIFKMSGSANVDAEKDDVYLCYSGSDRPVQAQVTIAGALQNELTITPKNYNTTLPLVAVVEGVETTFEANLSKFKVSPYQPLGCDMASYYNMGDDGTVYVDVTKTCTAIANMTEDGTIALTGKRADSNQAWLQNIAQAICQSDRKITLDLSDMSGETAIGSDAFKNCSNLECIVLSQGITQIGSSAFRGTSIALIDIPDGVETIGEYAFNGCGNLESVVLPASLTTIGTDAFADCSNLKTIYFRGTSDQMSELLIGISDDDPLKKAQWLCNSVSLYVSPNGSDGYYNGQTAAKPCQNMDGIRGGQSIFDKIRTDFSSNNNIIVFVDGTMTGQYTLYATDGKIDNTNVFGFNDKVASITFCGLYGLRNGEPMAVFDGNDMTKDVFAIKTTVPITFKNVKITNGKRGVFACGSSSSNRCNVTLGSGSVVTGNGSSIDNSDCCGVWVFIADVTLDGGKITANKGKEGGGVHLSHSENVSKFTMKSGSIETNEAQKCGGVYVTCGTSPSWSVFSMQGGTISGNTATTTEGKGVYIAGGGTFEMSGSAYINPDNDVRFSSKITITGALTTDGPVATITPYNYSTSTQVLEASGVTLSDWTGKFAVTPNNSELWTITTTGYLKTVNGVIMGKFSVGENEQVYFSRGNLQYKANGGGTWQFASNQYDYIGSANSNIGNSTYSGYIDLFGWGTGNNPTEKSDNNQNYPSFIDWGTNTINNADNIPNYQWCTLSADQWTYLLNSRPNASQLKGLGFVNEKKGWILLPDNWSLPGDLTFIAGAQSSDLGPDYYYNYSNKNNYSSTEWAIMEQAGAIFLPAASVRNTDGGPNDDHGFGYYWSCTPTSDTEASLVNFDASGIDISSTYDRYVGASVRLVLMRSH